MTKHVDFLTTTGPYGPFSNFSRHPVTLRGLTFATSEHCYQWHKLLRVNDDGTFVESPEQRMIREAKTPYEAKQIAYRYKSAWDTRWDEKKFDIMYEICLAKATQHDIIGKLLRSTGDATIREVSRKDPIWGIGPDGQGQNLLGKIWMLVRNSI